MGRDFESIFLYFDEWNIFHIPEEKYGKSAQNVPPDFYLYIADRLEQSIEKI